MIDVLLIQPNISDFYLTYQRIFPLGLWLISTYLKNRKIKTILLDTLCSNERKKIEFPKELDYLKKYYIKEDISPFALFKEFYKFGLSEEKVINIIKNYKPKIIGISSNFTTYYNDVLDLAKSIKNFFPEIKIIIGGHNTLIMGEEFLKFDFIDFVYFDFLPENFYKLVLKILNNENDFEAIPSIGYKQEGKIIIKKCLNEEIKFDIPDIDLINFENYKIGKYKSVSLIRSFACNYKCSFCSVNKMFYTHYKFNDEELVDLIKRLVIEKEIKAINFEDDNFFYNKNEAINFLRLFYDELKKYDIRLYFMNGLVYHLLDEEIILLLKRCGLKNINISAVHFENNFQREFNKAKLFDVIDYAVKNDMLVTTYLIVGLPEQKFDDVIKFIDELHSHKSIIGISPFYLYQTAELYEKLRDKIEKIEYIKMRGSAIPIYTEEYNREQIIYTLRYVRYLNSLLEKNINETFSENINEIQIKRKLTKYEIKGILLKKFIEKKIMQGVKLEKNKNIFNYKFFDY